MCLWSTNAPDMANSKDGQGHKDKHRDTVMIPEFCDPIECTLLLFNS